MRFATAIAFVVLLVQCHSLSAQVSNTYFDGVQNVPLYFDGTKYLTKDPTRGIEIKSLDGRINSDHFSFSSQAIGLTKRIARVKYTPVSSTSGKARIKLEVNGELKYVSKYKSRTSLLDNYPRGTIVNFGSKIIIETYNGLSPIFTLSYEATINSLADGDYSVTLPNGDLLEYRIIESGNPELDLLRNMRFSHDYFDSVAQFVNIPSVPPKVYLFYENRKLGDFFGIGGIDGYIDNSYFYDTPDDSKDMLVFGAGDAATQNPQVAIDVVAHEYTHFVCSHHFQYSVTGITRGIFEGLADMFASLIEKKYSSNNYFEFKETVMVNGVAARDYSVPHTFDKFSSYIGQEYTLAETIDYWYWLLAQDVGTTTIDVNNNGFNYSIDAVGNDVIESVLIRSLEHIPDFPTMESFAQSTLKVAKDLYSLNSPERTSIMNAWVAIGVLDESYYDSGTICSNEARISSFGTVNDGSWNDNYESNLNCTWLIQPSGCSSIEFDFANIDIHSSDTLRFYDGDNSNSSVLWESGMALPSNPIASSSGSVFINFITNGTGVDAGWEIDYQCNNGGGCSGTTVLNDQSGTFDDGSLTSDYFNNAYCSWLIRPPGADSIHLNFNSFNLELNDTLKVYEVNGLYETLIGEYTGSSIPPTIFDTTGILYLVFTSNSNGTNAGWEVTYNAFSTPFCSGGVTSLTAVSDTIWDGSGQSNYYNNTDCYWHINPSGASGVILNFLEFDLEGSDGHSGTLNDWIKVYDGNSTSSNLLGTYSGQTVPPSIISTGGELFIHFHTNNSEVFSGWKAYYTSSTGDYCHGTTTLTSAAGSFTDGSNAQNYNDNSVCRWLIQPPNATSIILKFLAFDTEQNNDGIIVYNGNNENAPILGVYSGNVLPDSLYSSVGSMLVVFLSNDTINTNGWELEYYSNISTNGSGYSSSINGYEYWFDNNYQSHVSNSIPPVERFNLNASIPTIGLDPGLHTAHFRFRQSNGGYNEEIIWSSVLTRFFFRSYDPALDIIGCEYWFDDNYGDKVAVATSGSTVDLNVDLVANNLENGLHTFHVRFEDDTKKWSSVLSRFIYKDDILSNNHIVEYRYWFNHADSLMYNVPLISNANPLLLLESIQTCHLDSGQNIIHFQFLDSADYWSSVYTDDFIVDNSALFVDESFQECSGNDYTFPDGYYVASLDSSLTHVSILSTPYGCDSTITTSITVNPTFLYNDTLYACQGDTVTFNDGSTIEGVTQSLQYTSSWNSVTGCDSLFVTQLIVNPTYFANDTLIACEGDSVTFHDGTIINGVTQDIQHANSWNSFSGCDSTILTQLIVQPLYFSSDTLVACEGDTITFLDGTIINGVSQNLQHINSWNSGSGCDSSILTNLIVHPVYSQLDTVIVCEGSAITFHDGSVVSNVNQNLMHTSILSSAHGCDSVFSTTVIVNSNFHTEIYDTICQNESYYFGGQIFTISGIYSDTLVSQDGCDSISNLNLNVKNVDLLVTQVDDTLFTLGSGDSYQWLDCGQSMQIIPGGTNSFFAPNANGIYAVAITENGCTDTTTCVNVNNVDLQEGNLQSQILIYPNPVIDVISIELRDWNMHQTYLEIYDYKGKRVFSTKLEENITAIDINSWSVGVYHVLVRNNQQVRTEQFVVQKVE